MTDKKTRTKVPKVVTTVRNAVTGDEIQIKRTPDLTDLQRYSPTPRSFMKNMSGEFVMLADVERLLNEKS